MLWLSFWAEVRPRRCCPPCASAGSGWLVNWLAGCPVPELPLAGWPPVASCTAIYHPLRAQQQQSPHPARAMPHEPARAIAYLPACPSTRLPACLHTCRCTTTLSTPQTTPRHRCQTTNCWAAAACTACCLEGRPAPPSHPPDSPALVRCPWFLGCCLLLPAPHLVGLRWQRNVTYPGNTVALKGGRAGRRRDENKMARQSIAAARGLGRAGERHKKVV